LRPAKEKQLADMQANLQEMQSQIAGVRELLANVQPEC